MVYCGLWIVLVVNIRFAAAHEKGAINSPYAVAMNALVTGSLIPLIGIYPTALVVLVTLKKTHSGRKFTYDSKPVPTVPAIPLRRVAVTTYEEEVRTQPESPFLVIGRNFDSAELSGDEEGYESREKEADAMLA